jgi:hypothetical protein
LVAHSTAEREEHENNENVKSAVEAEERCEGETEEDVP